MEDLDAFSQSFEKQEQERLRGEEQERLRREEEKQRSYFDAKPAAPAPVSSSARRPSALEILKQKAAASPVVDERAKKVETQKRLDARLRAAYRYLAQFGAMLRDARPVSERRFGVIYFGEASGMSLCEGSADYRFRRVDGEEWFDYVLFKFKVAFARPERLEVHAKLMVTGPFPCQIVLRGDYDQPGLVVEMENAGRAGGSRLRLGADELTDEALDELGAWLLGADDAFARFIDRPEK